MRTSRRKHDEDAVRLDPDVVSTACAKTLSRIRTERGDPRTFAVTSSRRGEGRSTVAEGLALANCLRHGRKTVRMTIESAARVDRSSQLDVERGGVDVLAAIEWERPGQIGRLPSRIVMKPGSESADPLWVSELVESLVQEGYDVVADVPPLPPVGEGDQFAASFDVVILVVEAGSTPAPAIRSAARSLLEPPVVVLNRTRSSVPRWFPIAGGG